MRVLIGVDPGGPHLGHIMSFAMMINNYLMSKGHYTTLDPNETVDIALCIAYNLPYEQVKSLKDRGAKIVHRLDGRARSIVKLYDQDEEVRRINTLADWTVFQSEYVKKHTTLPVQTIFGVEAPICTSVENSSIIYNGVDRSIFNETGDTIALKGKINILHVAMTAGIRKGPKYVLKIVEHLKGNPDIHFYFIGNQDKDLSCGHLIRAGVYRNVTYLGMILDQHLLAKYMRSCQVLLFPSVDDYCPNTVLEAMSCGLPVWYHNSGGTPELVQRGRYAGGVPITPENDIQPLYVLINTLDDFRQDAMAIVRENFTSEIVGQQYLDLFDRLLASSPAIDTHVHREYTPPLSLSGPQSEPGAITKKQIIRGSRFVGAVKKIIQEAFYVVVKLYLRFAGRSRSVPLLRIWMQSLALNKEFAPQSLDGRRVLQFWFEVQQYVDGKINQNCNVYYDHKHPKHYLWLSPKQYLYDGVREGERVLDIGCGASYYHQWIAEKASEVVGVDILPERIELARRNNQEPNVRFELMDVTRDLPGGQFDLAICSHFIEHLDDPIPVLNRLAKKVPRLLVNVPLVDAHWMKLVKRDIDIFWMDDVDHRREYTEDLLRDQLEASGWEIAEMVRGYDLCATAVSTYCSNDRTTG